MSVERLTRYICDRAHGAQGVSESKLTGAYCRGQFEATAVVERLAAIEDVLGDTYDLDRLRELVEADKDGRCVVLPCKVGTPVYWVVDGGVFECYLNLAAVEEVGKTVFLTREAAEAALAKEAK